jgi:hypothetical protein
MHVIVVHKQNQEDAVKIIDQSIDRLIQSIPAGSVKIIDQERTWNGSTMTFSFKGRKGIFVTTIRGTVAVTDKDVTIDAEIPGIIKTFVSDQKISDVVEAKAKEILSEPRA